MANSAKNAQLYVGEYKFGGSLNKIVPDRPVHLEDDTRFGMSGIHRQATQQDSKLDASGFWEVDTVSALSGPDENFSFSVIPGAQTVASYLPQGAGVLGNPGILYLFRQGEYKIDSPSVTGIRLYSISGQGEGIAPTGKLLHVEQSEVAAVDGSAVDFVTTSSANGYIQNLHVLEFTGSSAGLKTQWSANGTTGWTDVVGGAFTTIADVGSQQIVGTSLVVGRYMRFVLSGATFSSITFVVLFAKP